MDVVHGHEEGESIKLQGKHLTMFFCGMLGIGCLLPWNCVMTINDYYLQVFPRYHPALVLPLMNQPFQIATSLFMVYKHATLKSRHRITLGYSIIFVTSVGILVLNLVASKEGNSKVGAYIGLCVMSSAIGVGTGLLDGGVVGDLSLMPPVFLQSYFGGMGASGIFTAVLRLVTKAAFEKSNDGLHKGAIMFFVFCALIELICLLIYVFIFPNMYIVKHYLRPKETVNEENSQTRDIVYSSKIKLLRQNIEYAISITLIYVVSLAIFPSFLAERTSSNMLGSWYVLVMVAIFNFADLISRYTPLLKFIRIESRLTILIVVLCRFLFFPAFYLAAKYGGASNGRGDAWMIVLTVILGLTNGHFTVCAFIAAPKGYKGNEQDALGNILVLFLQLGLAIGVALSWLWLIGKGW